MMFQLLYIHPEIPPDTCPLRYVSTTPADLIVSLCVLTSSRSAAQRICSVQLRQSAGYAGLLYLVDAGARRSNLAEFSIKHRNNNMTYGFLFKIKHSVDTSTQI